MRQEAQTGTGSRQASYAPITLAAGTRPQGSHFWWAPRDEPILSEAMEECYVLLLQRRSTTSEGLKIHTFPVSVKCP